MSTEMCAAAPWLLGLWLAAGDVSVPSRGEVRLSGEVIVLQGDDETTAVAGTGFGVGPQNLEALARRVIAAFGDHFHGITVWQTFDDRLTDPAEAYQVAVRNEVRGLGPGLPLKDLSRAYGSNGVLRSILNMKQLGERAGDSRSSWERTLEIWGQESAHRWGAYMLFRDPRSGQLSDRLLGRDCAHWARFVETQGSVHDGFAWIDHRDGTFSWTESSKRYSELDLYAMGLLAPEEVAPFFLIEDVPDSPAPASCKDYLETPRSVARTVGGRRLDLTIEDIVAANGERWPPAGDGQDYWREAQVVLTSPVETLDDPRVALLAQRIDRARLFWEDWIRQATRRRMVICTQASADCGDARSDVVTLALEDPERAPDAGPIGFRVEIHNGGQRAATAVHATIEVSGGGRRFEQTEAIGLLEPGVVRSHLFLFDLGSLPVGAEVAAWAWAQSDFHHSRAHATFRLGGLLDAGPPSSGGCQLGKTPARSTPWLGALGLLALIRLWRSRPGG